MRLVAIYIPEGILPHIFGISHKGQVLNLGGEYNYSFNETDTDIEIIKREKTISLRGFGVKILR